MMVEYVRDLLNYKWHGEGGKGDVVHHCKCERAANRKWQAAMRIQIDTFFIPVPVEESDNHEMRPTKKQTHK